MLGHADSIGYGERLVFDEHRRTGIALLLRAVPVDCVATDFAFKLLRLHLGFLQRENVRLLSGDKIKKSLCDAGAKAVDVPGNQFHATRSFSDQSSINIP
ncbi:hypothetical protein SDC9_149524 [bioreactor metagenome]|uniref:Uncharacterized protein n=1 Tax=bioreactor metagenome TaxID=1076179 RepID=A0A645EJW9_9ZZZZ